MEDGVECTDGEGQQAEIPHEELTLAELVAVDFDLASPATVLELERMSRDLKARWN